MSTISTALSSISCSGVSWTRPMPQRFATSAALAGVRDAIATLASKRGIAIVAEDARPLGVLTAGDLTRLMRRDGDFMILPLLDVVNRTPKTARPEELGSAVVYRMEQHGIMAMPVLGDGDRCVGVIHLHDLMRARLA